VELNPGRRRPKDVSPVAAAIGRCAHEQPSVVAVTVEPAYLVPGRPLRVSDDCIGAGHEARLDENLSVCTDRQRAADCHVSSDTKRVVHEVKAEWTRETASAFVPTELQVLND